ncbi:TQXA domain-containing protein [Streptomyces armeniacus]|uniref:TQXA domain-containing protein n=1 Tax=Streptomyces armeniacus TaxID=83291 RepID=A0A345Y1M7_9ACTN|nr:TQXA domain-containing protein [Streptomyces armeniacus]
MAPGLLAAGAIAGAGPAAADSGPSPQGGATATLNGLKTSDQAVVRQDGAEDLKTGAGLFEMSVEDGGTLQTYSLDVHNPAQELARYQEVPWRASSLHDNRDAGRIRWILQHSYPQVNDLEKLASEARTGPLTPGTAAAGTQVAIWRFSDGADVRAVDPAAEKLADHLRSAARKMAEPKASLALTQPAVSGKDGGRLGPVTVHTSARNVTVTPGADAAASGVRITDKKGRPVTTARHGSELYFDVPAGAEPGTTSLTAQSATTIPVGRTLTGTGELAKSQTQILAGSSGSTVSATATARWADQGAIPALTAEKNCADGGVDVTSENKGDGPFRFTLGDVDYEIAPGETRTVTVPVAEDQSYKIEIPVPEGTGDGGDYGSGEDSGRTFTGVLDCEPGATGSDEAGLAPQTGAETPLDGGDDTATTGGEPDLAETGNSSNTPLIIGLALGLVVVGGAAMLLVRKRKPGGASGAGPSGPSAPSAPSAPSKPSEPSDSGE